jgi:hypothetical protein
MGDILPEPPGVYIDNVLYQYRIDKETEDSMSVYVYNENPDGTGYIFRERDDWNAGSLRGTQITKIVPLGRLHRDVFGDGGIDVEGDGSVYDTNVVYTYRVEPCYDPQFDPNCPGYELQIPDIYNGPDIVIYDAISSGDADREQYAENDEESSEDDELTEEELRKLEDEEEEDREMRLEQALFEAGRAALFAEALAMSQLKDGVQINMNSYYAKTIDGGVYNDTVTLNDKQLPDSKSGLRNGLAQQLLHQQMVDSQYNLGN